VALGERDGGWELRLGDPALSPGVPQRATAYGKAATLRGGVLTRDDPASRFTPPAGADPRPFALPAFAEEQAPFTLAPGERRDVVVEVRPARLGQRLATLRIRGVAAVDPYNVLEVRSQLAVEVVNGPLLQLAPLSLYVYGDANGAQAGHRTALLHNAGHFDLTVQHVALAGPHAARFLVDTDHGTGPFLLRSGEHTLLRLEYLPECDGTYGNGTSALDHQANVLVSSDGGNVTLPVGGASQGFCE
jgi:hypothetical protein